MHSSLRSRQQRTKALSAKGGQLDALPLNELMAAMVTNGPAA